MEKNNKNSFSLLRQKRFMPFYGTQFLGAFNDNVFKNALIILIAFQGAQLTTINENILINISAFLFILPFFLFSAIAGQWIDKYEKSSSIRKIKLLEILIMLFAGYAFYISNIYLLITCLFIMGSQSTFFGPAKYSYIPQHLAETELVSGNALVQMGTFVAILLGTMFGGILIGIENGQYIVAIVLIVVAIFGYLTSLSIPYTPSLEPDLKINWNIFTETFRNIKFLTKNKTVFLSVLGISWFWFLGATYLIQLPNYTKVALGGNEQVVTLFLTIFTIGIGCGSLLCDWMSDSKVEIGLVPFGSIGLTIFGVDMFFAQPDLIVGELVGVSMFLDNPENIHVLIDVLLIGIFGGFYIVPLFSLVQQRCEPAHRSRVIAGNNIFNALFMLISSVVAIALLSAGVTIGQLFLVVAIFNAVVALFIFSLVPEFFMRFLVWLLIHSIYRVRKKGLENIPDSGPALLVCNHVSFVDALIIAGCIRRPVRFVMHYKIYNLPVLNFIFRTANTISLAGKKENPELMEKAFMEIDGALNEGDIVCIFPEGKLTTDGELNEFKKGVEHILMKTPVPVISMCLMGLWGSAFSMHKSFILLRVLKGIRSRISLIIAPALKPQTVTASVLQDNVRELIKNN